MVDTQLGEADNDELPLPPFMLNELDLDLLEAVDTDVEAVEAEDRELWDSVFVDEWEELIVVVLGLEIKADGEMFEKDGKCRLSHDALEILQLSVPITPRFPDRASPDSVLPGILPLLLSAENTSSVVVTETLGIDADMDMFGAEI